MERRAMKFMVWDKPLAGVVSRRILLAGICVLTIAALIDPADRILHLKLPAFLLVGLVWVCRCGIRRRTIPARIWMAIVAFALLVPLLWTIVGLARYGVHNPEVDFGTAKSFLFLLLVPILISENIDLSSLISRTSILVALLTLLMVSVSFIFPAAFEIFYAFSLSKQNAIVAESRDLIGTGVGMFYYKTSALLVFPFAYYCNRLASPGQGKVKPLLFCAIYGAALLFSGARANFLGEMLIAGCFATRYLVRRLGWAPAVVIAIAASGLFAAAMAPKFANTQETSNSIKLGHLHSYEELFNAHPSILLWGEGADTAFYSEGYEDWTTVTELTYLELIRVFGIPMTLVFLCCLLWLALKIFRSGRFGLELAYTTYLLISASNPLLISSTGFLAVCAVWKEAEAPSSRNSAFHLIEPTYKLPPRLFAGWIMLIAKTGSAGRSAEARSR